MARTDHLTEVVVGDLTKSQARDATQPTAQVDFLLLPHQADAIPQQADVVSGEEFGADHGRPYGS
jgi:hypothetical protein